MLHASQFELTKSDMSLCVRYWSWAGMAWANLSIIIATGGFTAWVELQMGSDDDRPDRSARQCLRAWIAGTLRDPDYIPTTVRRLWLIHRAREVKLDCHVATAT
jgi:hypothetical protein